MDNMIVQTMTSYNDYLKNLADGSKDISNNLRVNNVGQAIHQIMDFSEGVNWLMLVNEKLSNLGYVIDLKIETINEFLSEINDALKLKDYVLVADIFEYELVPFFESCDSYSI